MKYDSDLFLLTHGDNWLGSQVFVTLKEFLILQEGEEWSERKNLLFQRFIEATNRRAIWPRAFLKRRLTEYSTRSRLVVVINPGCRQQRGCFCWFLYSSSRGVVGGSFEVYWEVRSFGKSHSQTEKRQQPSSISLTIRCVSITSQKQL